MSVLSQALDFPGLVLPVFAVAALLVSLLLRGRGDGRPLRYGDLGTALLAVMATGCLAHMAYAVFFVSHAAPAPSFAAPSEIEVDMRVSKGGMVEVFQNDWAHGSKSAPVTTGERLVYRFPVERSHIGLLRIDPSDAVKAHIEIFGVRVVQGNTTVQSFSPAQLKGWTLVNLSAPKEDSGAVVFDSTTDDPILWTSPLNIQIAEQKAPPPPSWISLYWRPLLSGGVALVLVLLLGIVWAGKGPQVLQQPLRPATQSIFLRAWVLGLIAIAAAGTTVYLQRQRASNDIQVEVDMMASGGTVVELWMNDLQRPPQKASIVPGQRHTYTFHSVPQHLTMLRLDPTDAANTRIILYGVAIKNEHQVFAQFGPPAVRGWAPTNISMPEDADGGVAWVSANNDPSLVARIDLKLPGGPLSVLSRLVDSMDAPFLLAITATLGALLMRMSTRSGRMQAVLVALIVLVALPLMLAVFEMNAMSPPGVRLAVGYANYHGYPKANEYLAAALLMLTTIVLGVAFAVWAGRRECPEMEEAGEAPSRRWVAWAAYAAMFASVFLYFLPDAHDLLRRITSITFQRGDWDLLNFQTWDFLLAKGLRPLRDFWFPYSGSYIANLPPPVGEAWWTMHCTLVISMLYVGLFKITGRRFVPALVMWAMLAPLAMMNIFAGWERYLVAVDVALLYVGARQARRWEWSTHVPFAFMMGYAFFFEQTQAIYPGVGIAADTLLSLAARFRGRDWSERLKSCLPLLKERMVTVALPAAAGIAGALAIFAANGMLRGLIDFDSTLAAQADYAALPSNISDWVRPALQPESVFLLTFLLLAYAVYRWWRSKDFASDAAGAAMIVLCCTSYVAMEKQVMRPHVMTQVRIFPYAAAIVFGWIVWRERRVAGRVVATVFLGCIAGFLVQRQFPQMWFARQASGPERVANAVEVLTHKRQEMDRAAAQMYTRPHFPAFGPEDDVVDHLSRDLGRRPSDRVYVLGDVPVLYILLDQATPWIINGYNNSPISEQQKIIDWFQREKPRFVVWSTEALSYDTVPHVVRLPLIYSYVVDHYRFEKAVGPYHVLVERAAGEAVDADYWRGVLGDRVDLGDVPALVKSSEYESCNGDTRGCEPMMVVRYPGAVGRGATAVTIDAPSGTWRVNFQVDGRREYLVNLDRLWFWDRTKRVPVRMWAADGKSAVTMEYRRPRGEVLY